MVTLFLPQFLGDNSSGPASTSCKRFLLFASSWYSWHFWASFNKNISGVFATDFLSVPYLENKLRGKLSPIFFCWVLKWNLCYFFIFACLPEVPLLTPIEVLLGNWYECRALRSLDHKSTNLRMKMHRFLFFLSLAAIKKLTNENLIYSELNFCEFRHNCQTTLEPLESEADCFRWLSLEYNTTHFVYSNPSCIVHPFVNVPFVCRSNCWSCVLYYYCHSPTNGWLVGTKTSHSPSVWTQRAT